MPYYLRIVTEKGGATRSGTPAQSIEAAMSTACAALRYGATDAWVDDEDGKKVADFKAIKKHCQVAENSN